MLCYIMITGDLIFFISNFIVNINLSTGLFSPIFLTFFVKIFMRRHVTEAKSLNAVSGMGFELLKSMYKL